jgi:hypothetical protein
MWLINVLLLWLVPIALALLLFYRVANGTPPFKQGEREMFFDNPKFSELTPWLGVKLAVLAATFFGIGLVEGVILPNLPFVWSALILVVTGGAALFLVALWYRSEPADPFGLQDRILGRNPEKGRPAGGIASQRR